MQTQDTRKNASSFFMSAFVRKVQTAHSVLLGPPHQLEKASLVNMNRQFEEAEMHQTAILYIIRVVHVFKAILNSRFLISCSNPSGLHHGALCSSRAAGLSAALHTCQKIR